MSDPTNPADDRPTIPGYELSHEIGRGAMGVVYRARDLAFDRDVAIKTLRDRPDPDSPAARRFANEVRVTSQLQHPGVPPVHAADTTPDGRPYLVMKLVRGDTLAALIAAPAADAGRLVGAFERLAEAVGYAHAQGVVHRDLKPANVMVGAHGEVQVMDWGLAKVLGGGAPPATSAAETVAETDEVRGLGATATRPGQSLGTPAYMPPEQALGATGEVDARSDVFGLGAVLCELLTGRPPYTGTDSEPVRLMAARGQLADAFARLAACGADPALVALCRRCLSVDRAARPASAGAVAAEVARLRAAAEDRARRAELDRVRADEGQKRARVQLALAVVLLVSGAGGGAAALWHTRREAAREQTAERDATERVLAGEREAADRRATEARLEGERDAEARNKARQARDGVTADLALAADLRRQRQYQPAGDALAHARELAAGGAPERVAEVDQARTDLALAARLDDIRYLKWAALADQRLKGKIDLRVGLPHYRAAFAGYGLDLTAMEPGEAAARIAASPVRAELVAAVDDWGQFEPDADLHARLLEVARRADPGEWTDRLRQPDLRADNDAIAKLAADARPATASPAALSMCAVLMWAQNPVPLLTQARAAHPTDFELAFLHGLWQAIRLRTGQEAGALEAARALRPENAFVWFLLGNAYAVQKNVEAAVAAFRGAADRGHTPDMVLITAGQLLTQTGDLERAADAYRGAIVHNPYAAAAYLNLGSIHITQKRYEQAAIYARAAIKFAPQAPKLHTLLGFALQGMGEPEAARAAFDEAARLEAQKKAKDTSKKP